MAGLKESVIELLVEWLTFHTVIPATGKDLLDGVIMKSLNPAIIQFSHLSAQVSVLHEKCFSSAI